MACRRVILNLPLVMAVAIAVSACSETTRYRVLTFLFDGVPRPGDVVAEIPPESADSPGPVPARPPTQLVVNRTKTYAHAPYREGRCGGCHSPTSGEIYRTATDGLCQTCHAEVPGQARYVHGPVAVNDCLFCHHHHAERYPALLVSDPTTICFRCHDQDDLTTGEHHAEIDRRMCVDCHDPHAGFDNALLRKNEP